MPIYEYECDECLKRFELKQGFSEEAVAACPQCQGKAHRVFYPTAIVFKGSGFYLTDSRKNTTPEKTAPEAKEAKKTTAPQGETPKK